MAATTFETEIGKIGGARTPNSAFLIQGVEGPVEVPAGKYYFNTKARCERMTKNHLSRGARQVHACLELATMNWRREVALVQEKDKERPLTITDISGETGLDKADVRRFLDELEDNGLAERRAKDGGALRKGAVLIYSWAQPQEPKKEKLGVRAPPIPEWIPDSWQALRAYANRSRYKIPTDLNEGARALLLERGERIARTLEEAQEEAARFWDEVCAQAPLYKEDRQDRQQETDATAAAIPDVQELSDAQPPSDQQQQPDSPTPIPTDETSEIQEVLLTYGPCDPDTARRLIQRCRDRVPDATADEVAQKIFECARNIDRGTRKPVGLLLDIVPKSFENYKRQPPETGREIESKIAAWKKSRRRGLGNR